MPIKEKNCKINAKKDNLIQNKIDYLLSSINSLEKKHNRGKNAVRIVAVSKTRGAEEIKEAYRSGVSDFGENYMQEALEKQSHLTELDITWHFIGKLQSNKASLAANNFDWIHSVDRWKIGKALSLSRSPELPPLNILIQVKRPEEAKSGVELSSLPDFWKDLSQLPRLKLRGIMYFPPIFDNFAERVNAFRDVLEKSKPIKDANIYSMGTSSDYEAAIAAGSNMLRLGTKIFGSRPSKT